MEQENEVMLEENAEDSNDGTTKDKTNWQAEASKFQRLAKRAETKLTKLEQELENLKGSREDAKPQDKPSQSSDLDYGQKAFLKASGINGPDEMALVKEHLKLSGHTLDSVIENPYFKQSLENLRATKANQEAADTGGSSASSKKGSAQYYLDKGEEPPRDAPFELRKEYVRLRMAADKSQKMFYNS